MKCITSINFALLTCAMVPAKAELCHVFGVHDGDTITVRCAQGDQMKIRLAEIDSPELKQEFGSASKEALSNLVFGKDVEIDKQTVDRYGRTVALIAIGSQSIQRKMLESGMAWCYTQYQKHEWCSSDEAKARSARRGLWKEPLPQPPWEFRHRKKQGPR